MRSLNYRAVCARYVKSLLSLDGFYTSIMNMADTLGDFSVGIATSTSSDELRITISPKDSPTTFVAHLPYKRSAGQSWPPAVPRRSDNHGGRSE